MSRVNCPDLMVLSTSTGGDVLSVIVVVGGACASFSFFKT